jgi:hypothetical protein
MSADASGVKTTMANEPQVEVKAEVKLRSRMKGVSVHG